MDRVIRVYDGTRYLVLFCCEKYDSICQRDRYLIRVKSGIIYVISPNYAKMKVDSYNSLPPGETIAFHNVIILIKSVFDKDENNYYCKLFLENYASYELP